MTINKGRPKATHQVQTNFELVENKFQCSQLLTNCPYVHTDFGDACAYFGRVHMLFAQKSERQSTVFPSENVILAADDIQALALPLDFCAGITMYSQTFTTQEH